MKYEISFICVAVLLAASVVSAVDVNPGQTILVNCNNTNESVPVTCADCQENQTCPECEDCGVCEVDKDIEAGERLKKKEGACDLDINCLLPGDSKKTERTYTIQTRVEKHEGDDIWIEQIIRDMFGTVVDSKTYDMESEDIVTSMYKYNFTCPTEVIMEGVNYRTCSVYLDDFVNETSPLFYQLSLGQTTCMQALISCEGNTSANRDLMNQYKDLYTDCESQKNVMEKDVSEMNETYHDMSVSVTGQVASARRGWVPGEWMTYAIIEAVVIIFGFAAWLFGPKEL